MKYKDIKSNQIFKHNGHLYILTAVNFITGEKKDFLPLVEVQTKDLECYINDYDWKKNDQF